MRKYNALLLSAGLGTRLQPFTDIWPKCMMPVQGRPLLDYWIANLTQCKVEKILINTHHKHWEISQYIRRRHLKNRVIESHETSLLGTAGTIRKNREFCSKYPLIVAHADNLCVCNFQAFVEHHETRSKEDCPITLMSFVTDKPDSCGILEIDENDRLQKMYEKMPNARGNIANGAVYIFEPEVLYWIQNNNEVTDISTQVLPQFMGKISVWHNHRIHRDIGSAEQLFAAQHENIDGNLKSLFVMDDWQRSFKNHEIQNMVMKNVQPR